MEGMRGEDSIAELCRREGIAANLYYQWSKDFLEAGKTRLAGDTKREAASTEVTDLRKELGQLKELVTEVLLENRVLKKNGSWIRLGRGRYVRLAAAEKMEVICLVENSYLSIRRTFVGVRVCADRHAVGLPILRSLLVAAGILHERTRPDRIHEAA